MAGLTSKQTECLSTIDALTVDGAVSYTHLDVYKRQLHLRFRADLRVHLVEERPVSYTHLDVYKRQDLIPTELRAR